MNQTSNRTTAETPSSIFNYGKWREGFLQAILIGAAIFGFVALSANFVTGATSSDLITYSTAFAVLLLATLIRFPYWFKAVVLLALVYALAISGFLDTGLWGDSRVFLLALVIMACLLFSPLAGIFSTIIGVATTAVFGWLILTSQYQLTSSDMPVGAFADWLTGALTNILLSVVVIIGLRAVQREFERAREQAGSALQELQEESKNLELRVQERTNQLEQKSELLRASAFVTRNIAELQDVPTLLERAARWTSDLFGFYHVAIYLFDEDRKIAFLQAASSDIGRRMLEDGFQIESDAKSVIRYVSEQNKSYIITGMADERVDLVSQGKLEPTRSQIVMPLNGRGKTLGAIDFQSKEARVFNQDEIEILQSLADQIAISIDSVRLLNETQAFVNELETLTAQQTEVVWKRYLANRTIAYQFTPAGIKSVMPGRHRNVNKKGLQVPIRLRGQTIGMLTFQGKETTRWTEREADLTEKVATQIALALDNSRLLEETRQQALQQQTVNEISARLNRSLDIDTLLQTTARELGTLPEVAEASVFIGESQRQNRDIKPKDGS
ncbi:MAG TPA: GAF domain-containing protein [Anaerolineales bacterium]|nr:GAF domain-containing protein [Anaerolineales bacterium]